MASLEQLDEEHKLNPITQPDLDVEAIELPADGPMVFEMDVEVRPDFPLPAYKALSVEAPSRKVEDVDIEAQVKAYRERFAQLVPKFEGGAEVGDFLTANLTFHLGGKTYNEAKEIQFRLQPELRFQDGVVPGIDQVLAGVKPEESREADARINASSPDPEIAGKAIKVKFDILDLKSLRLPEMDADFFKTAGFDDEEDLRAALRGVLERRYEFQKRQAVRRAILDKLVAETPFELPADLVGRQEKTTLRRLALELPPGRAHRQRPPRPRGRAPVERPRDHAPEPQGVLHPRQDRRGRGREGRGLRPRRRDRDDRRPLRGEPPARPGPGRERGARRRHRVADP